MQVIGGSCVVDLAHLVISGRVITCELEALVICMCKIWIIFPLAGLFSSAICRRLDGSRPVGLVPGQAERIPYASHVEGRPRSGGGKGNNRRSDSDRT